MDSSHFAEALDIKEDVAVSIFANYKQVRSFLHKRKLGCVSSCRRAKVKVPKAKALRVRAKASAKANASSTLCVPSACLCKHSWPQASAPDVDKLVTGLGAAQIRQTAKEAKGMVAATLLRLRWR